MLVSVTPIATLPTGARRCAQETLQLVCDGPGHAGVAAAPSSVVELHLSFQAPM